jgi:hypothetical protein
LHGTIIREDYSITLLNYDGVLWRHEHEWAYDGCVLPVAFTKDFLIVQSDDMRYDKPHLFHLDLKNGELLEGS